MCRCYGETVDRLLLHCKYDHALWSEVFLTFGIQGMMHENVISQSTPQSLDFGTSVFDVVGLVGT